MSARDKGSGKVEGWVQEKPEEGPSEKPRVRGTLPGGLLLSDMPKFKERKKMPFPVFVIAFTSTHWLNLNGRNLLPQEIEGIIYKASNTKRGGHDRFKGVHDKINDPQAKTTTVLKGFPLSKILSLRLQSAHLLKQYLEDKDIPEARKRYDNLKGFVGKLILYPAEWKRKDRPTLGSQELLEEQTYFIGALIKWCMGGTPGLVWKNDVATMVQQEFKINFTKTKFFELYADFTNESHDLAQHVKRVLDVPNHATFFGHQARKCHVECSKANILQYPVKSYPDIPAESQPLLATTAEYLAAMTISAPAESSRQPTATNPPAESSYQPITTDFPGLDFDEFFHNNAYAESIAGSIADTLAEFESESEPEEAPPAAGGGTTKDKGRARESSSGSPEEDASGKGKGKQVVRKKPRAEK